MSTRLRAIARETVSIAEAGHYEHDHRTVDLGDSVTRAAAS